MNSDIALLKSQIEHEYLAATLGLSGLAAGTSRHQWITARQERLGCLHEALQEIVGGEAIMMVTEVLNQVPEHPTRVQVQQVIQREWGQSEDALQVLCELQRLWQQFDILSARIGVEAATKMLCAVPSGREEVLPS